jgi:uncharacterized protein (TIGR00730 family)
MHHWPSDSPGDVGDVPPEAVGEDEEKRPQPADESLLEVAGSEDLLEQMRHTVSRLAADGTARGDLKILSRTLRELRYAFKVFRPYRRRRKVTIFGSARTSADHPASRQAEAVGRAMAKHGWMVITGAGGGIMEAGHRGSGRDHALGLNIMLPFEQAANPIIHGDPKLVTLKYFFTRKLMFVKECSGVVCCQGGFGTLDETLEVLTLLQTGKQTMLPLVLLDAPGASYWHDFGQFFHKHLLSTGMISPEDVSLYRITDSVEACVGELCRFYRNYHSMRYVRNQLVLRMQTAPNAEAVDAINTNFSDILVSGKFVTQGALDEERSEPELDQLPRLVFHFNRKSLGRLRQLIDYLNDPNAGMQPEKCLVCG